MPTTTYTPLANLTISTASANVTFSSITSGYRDLILVCNLIPTSGSTDIYLLINGVGNDNDYKKIIMSGNGSTTTSSNANPRIVNLNALADASNGRTNIIMNFMDFATTDKNKLLLYRVDNAALATEAGLIRWVNTGAITSFTLSAAGTTWAVGSTFALYGVIS